MSDKIHFQNIFVPGMQVANNRIPIPLANGNFWRAQQGGYSIGVTPDRVVYLSKDGINYVEQFTLDVIWSSTDAETINVLGGFAKRYGDTYVMANTYKPLGVNEKLWTDMLEKRNAETGALQDQVEFTNSFYHPSASENDHMMRVHISDDHNYVFSHTGEYLFQLDSAWVEDDAPYVLVEPSPSSTLDNYLWDSNHWNNPFGYGRLRSLTRETTKVSNTLHESPVFYLSFRDIITYGRALSVGPILSRFGDIKCWSWDDYGIEDSSSIGDPYDFPNKIEFDYNVVYQETSTYENHYAEDGPFHVTMEQINRRPFELGSPPYSGFPTEHVIPGILSFSYIPAHRGIWMGNTFTPGRRAAAVFNFVFGSPSATYDSSRPSGTGYIIVYPESIKLSFKTQNYRGIPLMKVARIDQVSGITELHTPTITYSEPPTAPGVHTFYQGDVRCTKDVVNYSAGNVEAIWPELIDADTGEIVFLKYSGTHKIVSNYTADSWAEVMPTEYLNVDLPFLADGASGFFDPFRSVPNLSVVKGDYEEPLLTLPEYLSTAVDPLMRHYYLSGGAEWLPYYEKARLHSAFLASRFVLDSTNTGYIFNTGSWGGLRPLSGYAQDGIGVRTLITSVSGALHLESNQGVCKINGALYSVMASTDGITFSELSGGAVVNEIVVPHASTAASYENVVPYAVTPPTYVDKTRVVLVSPTEILYPTTNTLINLQTWESTPYLEAWWEDDAQAVPGTFRGLAVGSGKHGLHFYVERITEGGVDAGTFFQVPGGEVKQHVCSGTHLNLSAAEYFYDGAFITDAYQPYFSTTFEIESEGE